MDYKNSLRESHTIDRESHENQVWDGLWTGRMPCHSTDLLLIT